MALRTITKVRCITHKFILPIYHYELIPLVFQTYKPIISQILSFRTFLRTICTETPPTYVNHSLYSGQAKIVDDLISIFIKKPFSLTNEELKDFGPKLTTLIVETVLKRFNSWKFALVFFTWASNQYGYKHNCYTYTTMALILSHAQQKEPLKVLASDIVSSRCSMTPGALGSFVRCLGSLGMVEEANMLFDQVKETGLCIPSSYTYNCLLETISKSGSIDLLERRFKEMLDLGWQPDKYTLTPLLQVYFKAGKFEKALDVYNEIYKQGLVDGHVFSILVLSFSKWGEVDKAFQLIETMADRNIRLNEKTFCVLIHGFVRESRVDKALQLFDLMRNSGHAPDMSLYDALIDGFCKKKNLEKALYLYSDMKELGINPDVKLLTKIIPCLSDEGEMLCILEKNLDQKSVILLYNSVLSALVSHGSLDKAYHLLQAYMGNESHDNVEVKKLLRVEGMVRPNSTSFCIVIDGFCKTGKMDLALNLFKEMVQKGYKQDLLLYNNLIDGLCQSNRLEESYELLQRMKESGFAPTQFTYNAIFGCLCRREDVAGAHDLVKVMRIHGYEPWIKHYTLLVKKLCEHGRAAESVNFLVSLVQEGFIPDIMAYSAAIYGLIRIQELDRAVELFRDIFARGHCPDVVAYNVLINGFCKAKRILEAEDILNEMLDKGLVPSVVTYNLLIDGWCKNGNTDKALLCLSKMAGKEREPNVITYSTVVDGLCNAGKPDDALLLWNEMKIKRCSPNRIAFMALIHGLCKCGRPDAALGCFREMEEKGMEPDIFVFVKLIEAFLSDMKPYMAFEILKEMVDKGSFPDPLDKHHLLLREAIFKLCRDTRTSSIVKNLLAEGVIPTISLSDFASEGGDEPNV